MAWEDEFPDEIGTYSATYVPAEVCEAMLGSLQLGVFLHLDVEPDPLRIWLGFNDIPAGIDSVDPDDAIYLGGGRLINVPTFEVLINGQADDVEISMNGIDPKEGQRVVANMPDVRGKEVRIGIAPLDKYHQPISAIIPLWSGQAARPRDAMPPVKGPSAQRTMNLSIAAIGGHWMRSRPSQRTWSDPHWKIDNPTDDFCKNTSKYNRGYAPVWPNYG